MAAQKFKQAVSVKTDRRQVANRIVVTLELVQGGNQRLRVVDQFKRGGIGVEFEDARQRQIKELADRRSAAEQGGEREGKPVLALQLRQARSARSQRSPGAACWPRSSPGRRCC